MLESVAKRAGIIALNLLVVACGSRNAQAPFSLLPQHAAPGRPHSSSNPITHVVVIMQENRSFDNMFYGFPGAETATFGYGHGVKYTMVPKHLKFDFDLNHYHYQFLEDSDSGQNERLGSTHSRSPYDQGLQRNQLGKRAVMLGVLHR